MTGPWGGPDEPIVDDAVPNDDLDDSPSGDDGLSADTRFGEGNEGDDGDELLDVEGAHEGAVGGGERVSVDALIRQAAKGNSVQGALPLDVRTGDPGVDAAVAQLVDLDRLPITDHAQVFTEVHRALQDALVDLDRG